MAVQVGTLKTPMRGTAVSAFLLVGQPCVLGLLRGGPS